MNDPEARTREVLAHLGTPGEIISEIIIPLCLERDTARASLSGAQARIQQLLTVIDDLMVSAEASSVERARAVLSQCEPDQT